MKLNLHKFGGCLIVFGFALMLIETAYFGWNFKSGSEMEILCDVISALPVIVGWSIVISNEEN
jgi:hypothetical protein